MGECIKKFSDGSFLEYDKGSFDDWCVYMTEPNGTRTPPKDTDYFSQLQIYANKYGVEQVYNDFVQVYDLVHKKVNSSDLTKITQISERYGTDAIEIDKIFSTLYMAMIAEENKEHSILGKRIKRLGLYVLLYENKDVVYAATFMKNMKWREIDALCKDRGF